MTALQRTQKLNQEAVNKFTFRALSNLVLSNKVTNKNESLINLIAKITFETSFF